MKTYDWKEAGNTECSYYYDESNGRIVGQVNKIVHTKIWLAKIIDENNQEKFLGQYISETFSKKSVEEYWIIVSRTLIAE